MRIQIEARGFELTSGIREHVLTQMHLNLASFEGHIVSAHLYLADTNGPQDGPDKKTLMRVGLDAGLTLEVETVRDDLYTAIALATRRARRAVRRTLSKRRRMERLAQRQLRQYAG